MRGSPLLRQTHNDKKRRWPLRVWDTLGSCQQQCTSTARFPKRNNKSPGSNKRAPKGSRVCISSQNAFLRTLGSPNLKLNMPDLELEANGAMGLKAESSYVLVSLLSLGFQFPVDLRPGSKRARSCFVFCPEVLQLSFCPRGCFCSVFLV